MNTINLLAAVKEYIAKKNIDDIKNDDEKGSMRNLSLSISSHCISEAVATNITYKTQPPNHSTNHTLPKINLT